MDNTKDSLTTIQETDSTESDKPPLTSPRLARAWRVAVIANVKGESTVAVDAPSDAGAEFDKRETIQAIQAAIESDGHSTVFLPADSNLPFALRDLCPDICFNIAEGLGGDAREAQVPALLEMLNIPYTASRVLANAIGLDKTMTKRLWREAGLPTAPFQEFISGSEDLDPELVFPLFVKPSREGTGMGMDGGSIVYDEFSLRTRVNWVIQNYKQPALVEAYLPGREFTIGILGHRGAAQFGRMSHLYDTDGFHRFPVLEVDNHNSITPGVYGYKTKTLHFGEDGIPSFICPSHISDKMANTLREIAIRAHQAIGAEDVSRVDLRMDAQGKPLLMEINTLPGLTAGFSDLCIIAKADGISYKDLILEILYLGASRFGLVEPNNVPAAHAIRIRELETAG
jgi:D-alanine-D-alanine ligase